MSYSRGYGTLNMLLSTSRKLRKRVGFCTDGTDTRTVIRVTNSGKLAKTGRPGSICSDGLCNGGV